MNGIADSDTSFDPSYPSYPVYLFQSERSISQIATTTGESGIEFTASLPIRRLNGFALGGIIDARALFNLPGYDAQQRFGVGFGPYLEVGSDDFKVDLSIKSGVEEVHASFRGLSRWVGASYYQKMGVLFKVPGLFPIPTLPTGVQFGLAAMFSKSPIAGYRMSFESTIGLVF